MWGGGGVKSVANGTEYGGVEEEDAACAEAVECSTVGDCVDQVM